MLNFKTLRVRAYLQTGVISDQFLPLDGILYFHLVRKTMGEQFISKPGESNVREGASVTLPIKKAGPKNDAWFYHCSFAQWPQDVVEDQTFYVKRFDLALSGLLADTKKIEIARGKYKAYHVNVYYRHALYVEWYCTADKEELEKLLAFCTHLGKKTAQGWGAVKKWEVIEWPEDWAIRGPGNKLMRSVPIMGDGFLYGVRPSYWNDRHVFSCKMPDK
jgi:CRISPR type IV-associated protein Csf3